MFTGIVQTTGSVLSVERKKQDRQVTFDSGSLSLEDLNVGDSIAVNGVCLTIIKKTANSFSVDVSKETLEATTFLTLKQGSRVNFEKAMRLADRFNGHVVSGHVDGIAKIVAQQDEGRGVKFDLAFPVALMKFISKKSSVTVDGVSLTVNDVEENVFSVNIIPHTLSETIFSEYTVGTEVNLEIDQIARYLDKLIHH